MAHLPAHGQFTVGARLPDLDGGGPLPGKSVDGEPRQGGLDPDDVSGGKVHPTLAIVLFHVSEQKNIIILMMSLSPSKSKSPGGGPTAEP